MTLLPVDEAQARVLALGTPATHEQVRVHDALGRWAVQPIVAERTQPARDLSAMDGYAIRFADLSPSEQDALLTRVEEGDVTSSWPINPKQFFRMAVGHALEGFYADPGNGGNHDGVSWRMIGFEVRG